MSSIATARRQLPLRFAASSLAQSEEKPRKFRDSLSAVAVADEGRTLFVGVDETVDATPTIERLTRAGDGYAEHQMLRIEDFLDLPDPKPKKGRVPEVDVEGLALDGEFLWLVGSHSSRRKKPKNRSVEENLARLADVDLDANRVLLGRIPLVTGPGGTTLAKRDGDRRAAQLSDNLRDTLVEDPLLGPFLRTYENKKGERVSIPGKDNGFDIEGLVVTHAGGGSQRVYLGLRGPVLRGWATILEIAPVASKKGSELELGRFEASKDQLYRRHLLDLEGLGVRDLRAHGEDILILAGPTMTLDGEVALYRWVGGLRDAGADSVNPLEPGRIERLLTLPHGHKGDRPEGMAVLSSGELLVVYDGPSEARHAGEHGVLADVFSLDAQQ